MDVEEKMAGGRVKVVGVDDPPRAPPAGWDVAPGLSDVESATETLRRAAAAERVGENPMFSLLVRDDDDMVGLVAYALYKQSKRDWMIAFADRADRPPNPDEMQAYILGERTDRRVATYRRLAQDALEHFRRETGPGEQLMSAPAGQRGAAAAPMAGEFDLEQPERRGLGRKLRDAGLLIAVGAVLAALAIWLLPRVVGR